MASHAYGEVPHYIHAWQLKRWISQNLQLSLPLPPRLLSEAQVEKNRVWQIENKNIVARMRQPARFPKNHSTLCRDPDWRAKYNARWVAKRKAAGLPYVIRNPEKLPGYREPEKKRAASVRLSEGRKTA